MCWSRVSCSRYSKVVACHRTATPLSRTKTFNASPALRRGYRHPQRRWRWRRSGAARPASGHESNFRGPRYVRREEEDRELRRSQGERRRGRFSRANDRERGREETRAHGRRQLVMFSRRSRLYECSILNSGWTHGQTYCAKRTFWYFHCIALTASGRVRFLSFSLYFSFLFFFYVVLTTNSSSLCLSSFFLSPFLLSDSILAPSSSGSMGTGGRKTPTHSLLCVRRGAIRWDGGNGISLFTKDCRCYICIYVCICIPRTLL